MMCMKLKIYLACFLVIITQEFLVAQSPVLNLRDSKTKESIPFANLVFYNLLDSKEKYQVTDQDGLAVNRVKSPRRVVISSVGYKTLFDTIAPGETKTFYLNLLFLIWMKLLLLLILNPNVLINLFTISRYSIASKSLLKGPLI